MGVNFFDNILNYLSRYNSKSVIMGDVLPKIQNLQNDYTKYRDCIWQEYCLENENRIYEMQLFDKLKIFIFVDENNLCKLEIITKMKSMTTASMFLDKNLNDDAFEYLGSDLYETDSTIYYNCGWNSNIQTITNIDGFNVCEKIFFNDKKNYNDIDLLEGKKNNEKIVILYSNGNPYYACYNGVDYNERNKYQEFSQDCVDFVNKKYQEIYNVIGYSKDLEKIKKKELKS